MAEDHPYEEEGVQNATEEEDRPFEEVVVGIEVVGFPSPEEVG